MIQVTPLVMPTAMLGHSSVKQRPVIGVDVNDVVLDPIMKVKALMRITGQMIPPYEFGGKHYAINRFGVVPDQYDRAMKCLFENHKWLSKYATLLPGAGENLRRLHEWGFDVVYVTACRGITEDWLKTFLLENNLPCSEIVAGEDAKVKTDFYGQCFAAIDNDPAHLEPLLGHTDTKPVLMCPAPGTTGCNVFQLPQNLAPGIKPVFGWHEGSKYVFDEMAEQLAAA